MGLAGGTSMPLRRSLTAREERDSTGRILGSGASVSCCELIVCDGAVVTVYGKELVERGAISVLYGDGML